MLSPAYALIPNCQHHQRRLQQFQFQRKPIRLFMSLIKSKIYLSPILRQNGLEQKVKLQWEQQFLRSWNAYPRLLGLWIMLSYLCLPWVILCFYIALSSACCQVSYLCCLTSSSFTIITGRFCILVIHSLMLWCLMILDIPLFTASSTIVLEYLELFSYALVARHRNNIQIHHSREKQSFQLWIFCHVTLLRSMKLMLPEGELLLLRRTALRGLYLPFWNTSSRCVVFCLGLDAQDALIDWCLVSENSSFYARDFDYIWTAICYCGAYVFSAES